jgi:hypothetical protein
MARRHDEQCRRAAASLAQPVEGSSARSTALRADASVETHAGSSQRDAPRSSKSGTFARIACDEFTSIGMEVFAERVRCELLAMGETVRKRSAETGDDLTPQQRQIAEPADVGLPSSEIVAQLIRAQR